MSLLERRKMVEYGHALSVVSQTALLGLNRSGLYYRPITVDNEDLVLMALLDKQYLKTPFYGYRKMTVFLHSVYSGESGSSSLSVKRAIF